MELGLIGLGKMGGNMRERLRNAGHTVVGYDRNPDVSDVASLADMVEQLPAQGRLGDGAGRRPDPRHRQASWPSCSARATSSSTAATPVDRRPSHAELLAAEGHRLRRLRRLRRGLGPEERLRADVRRLRRRRREDPADFDALKPEGDFGFVHAGQQPGAGHFAKMVHNGIEYAIMQAYAEGWELLEKVDLVDNVTEVFDSWRQGTVIRSWLLDLLVAALQDDTHLDKIAGYAADSGEGRWTVEAGDRQRRRRCRRSPRRCSRGSSPSRTRARR